MQPSDLTSRDAVLSAIEEFNELGREAFLAKYGFGSCQRYFVNHEGRLYDSKAILGAALGKQFPKAGALNQDAFRGGDQTTSILEKLGFRIIESGNGEGMIPTSDSESLKPLFQQFFAEYPAIRASIPFRTHEGLWSIMSRIRAGLEGLSPVKRRPNLSVKWSLGAGNWNAVPWIAIMDRRETDTTQTGRYCVLLFREDCQGVFLTLNQGVTEVIKEHGRADGLEELQRRAEGMRVGATQLVPLGFNLDGHINLNTKAELGVAYEKSTVAYKYYSASEFPEESVLARDLEGLLEVYDNALNADAMTPPRTWIFQANPKFYDIDGALKNLPTQTWLVKSFKAEIKRGDDAIIWRSGPKAGIVATAKILTNPEEIGDLPEEAPYSRESERFEGNRLRVRLEIVKQISPEIPRTVILETPGLGNLTIITSPQATNFAVTPEQKIILNKLISGETSEAVQRNEVRTWIYAPGEDAVFWDEFYANGLMAIGWDKLGDLRQYNSVDEIARAHYKAIGRTENPRNDARACFDFLKTMKPGDNVFVKRGLSTVVGAGVVKGGYEWSPDRLSFKHTRKVQWTHKGEWAYDGKMALKALTDITEFPGYIERLKSLVGANSPGSKSFEPYFISDALDGLFLDREEFELMRDIWDRKKNLVIQGAPGVGKSFIAKRLAYSLIGSKDESLIETVQFHQSYSYEDFIQGLRPTTNGFALRNGIFHRFCKKQRQIRGTPTFLLLTKSTEVI